MIEHGLRRGAPLGLFLFQSLFLAPLNILFECNYYLDIIIMCKEWLDFNALRIVGS